jgi:hypothetical protein
MSAPALAKSDYDVLNVVALKKMAAAPTVAHVTGHEPAQVERVLDDLAERGLVVIASGAALPTDDADPVLKAAAGVIYAHVRSDPDIAGLVEKFETINARFLTTMSSWQQIDVGGRKVVNDHSDPAYDEKVIERLDRLVERFGLYPRRFRGALDGIASGRHELVSSPTEDSVHNIWFEFHEDLLRTIGRERTE